MGVRNLLLMSATTDVWVKVFAPEIEVVGNTKVFAYTDSVLESQAVFITTPAQLLP
jgi:hypothetical protein